MSVAGGGPAGLRPGVHCLKRWRRPPLPASESNSPLPVQEQRSRAARPGPLPLSERLRFNH
jgi:hypothetical protein